MKEVERRRAVSALLALGVIAATGCGSEGAEHGDLGSWWRRSANGLGRRALAEAARGDLAGAERYARLAVARDPTSAPSFFNLGVILEKLGRLEEAERVYRQALTLDPGQAEAAANLGGILIRAGKAATAIPILHQALVVRPAHEACWTNLVVALAGTQGAAEASAAVAEAARHGVRLAPELLESLQVPKAAENPR